MNYKTDTLLDKHVSEDRLHELKASEITKVRKEERGMGAIGCLFFGGMFVLEVSIIALLLWFNKITLFISIVVLLANIPISALTYLSYRDTMKLVKQIAERVNNI